MDGNSVAVATPIDDELVVPEPSDHVEVEHRVDAVDRHRAVIDEVRRAEQALLLRPRSWRQMTERRAGLSREAARASSSTAAVPGRVVVGAAAHGAAHFRIERAVGGRAEMVEVRADDDILAAQRRVAARE